MNIEDFCTYEQALALKKLGFDLEAEYKYLKIDSKVHRLPSIEVKATALHALADENSVIECPTLAQAHKWLRKEKHYHINSMYFNEHSWNFIIYNMENDNDNKVFNRLYTSYEEALSAGITECIKLLEKED